jgi:hypothetical protein
MSLVGPTLAWSWPFGLFGPECTGFTYFAYLSLFGESSAQACLYLSILCIYILFLLLFQVGSLYQAYSSFHSIQVKPSLTD